MDMKCKFCIDSEDCNVMIYCYSDSDIMSHMHVRKPRSFSLAGGEIADEAALESLNLEMGSLAIPQVGSLAIH